MNSPVPPPRRRQLVIDLRPSVALRVLRPWWFAVAAAGVMTFIAYGSFVPFEFQPREWDDATAAFGTALAQWASPPSRSDFAANIALGIPLGFCALGALRVDRPRRWLTAIVGLTVAVACGVYASAVEFGQLFFRERVCSGADIFAQTLGGVVGTGGWVLAGQWMTDRLRRAFDADGVKASTAPLLIGYAGLLLVTQTMPLDLTASPYVIGHRLKTAVTWQPLGELFERPDADTEHDLKTMATWCELFALYLPAGLLLAGLPGKFRTADGFFRVVGVGLLAVLVLETCQVLVQSRHPSTTDIIIGTVSVVIGWATARILAARGTRKWRAEVALLLGQAWAAVLAVVAWFPYQFYPAITGERLRAMSWLPFRDAIQGQYLWVAEDLIAKFALSLPLGALAAWGFGGSTGVASRPAGRWVVPLAGVLASGLVAAMLEFGQALLPARTVCPTDVLLAMAGGWVGAMAERMGSSRVGPAAVASHRPTGV